jgi:predicted RNase H-like HicB family nuclease
MRRKVQVSFTVPVSINQKDSWWIATCPIFDVVTQGQTLEEAKVNIQDALVFFLQSCIKRGTIFEVLRDAGFDQDLSSSATLTEAQPEEGTVQIDVPLPFVIAAQNPDSSFHDGQ